MRGLVRRIALAPLLGLILAGAPTVALAADPAFPALSGRVVDAAGLLDPDAKAALESKLKAHEDKTSDQVVVATVPSLKGLTVEEYGNRLFRDWKLGWAKTDNGALLLVAPGERKVRIEVGYGLEGALTDALAKVIIATAITPKLKAGDFAGGINAGVDGILSILSGDAEQWRRRASPVRADAISGFEVAFWMLVILGVVFAMWRMNAGPGGRRRRGRGGGLVVPPTPSCGGWGGGFSGGGGFGGGFSGGGGSSGGGGASGDW